MKTIRKKHNYTLVELMFSSAIGLLVMGTLMAVYLYPYQSWKRNSYESIIETKMHETREKILRHLNCEGMEGRVGLRSASYQSISINKGTNYDSMTFEVDNSDLPGSGQDIVKVNIFYSDENIVAYFSDKSGSYIGYNNILENVKVQRLKFEKININTEGGTKHKNLLRMTIKLQAGYDDYYKETEKTFDIQICND